LPATSQAKIFLGSPHIARIAEHSDRLARTNRRMVHFRIGEQVSVFTSTFSRPAQRFASVLLVGGLVGTMATTRAVPHRTPSHAGVPGLSFRISSSVKVYPGDTPRGQDDEVMRGRGVAANDHSHIEFLAFTPAPSGVTTDDYLIGGDSGKTYIFHSGSQTFADANDTFGGPGVVTIGRVMGGGRGFGAGGAGGGARGPRGGRGRGGVGQGFLNQIQLLDVKFNLEELGADTLDGRA